MVNTLKVAACVTAAGRAPSVTCPPTSALTSHAATTGRVLLEPVSATRATKEKTAKKVIVLISHRNISSNHHLSSLTLDIVAENYYY